MRKKGMKKIAAYGLSVAIVLAGMQVPATQAAAKIRLNKTKATLTVGKKLKLTLKKARKKVTWSSSAKSVATVTKKGLVTAKKQGKATITAKSAGKKYTCKVTVKKKTGAKTVVSTSPDTAEVSKSPAPSARPTLRPTASVQPVKTPTATSTAKVSSEPDVTSTAKVTDAPDATTTAKVSSAPDATSTAKVSNEPDATATARVSSEPNATSTAKASSAPNATSTAKVSSAPNATSTAKVSSAPNATSTAKVSSTPDATATAKVSNAPDTTATAKVSNAPDATTKPSVSPTQTPSSVTTQTPTPTPTQGGSLSASHEKPASADSYTLKVGKMSVSLGMTEAEVKASIGAAPDRTDTSPLGMTEYIYNPSKDYTNYLLIQFADGKVVGMSTISAYFCYDNVVAAGDSVSTLTGKGFGTGTVSTYYQAVDADNNKKGTSAYLLKQDNASVIAFSDYWGSKDTYGVYVYSNAYALDTLSQPKKGTYTTDVLTAMGTQAFEMMNAFRVYKSMKPLIRDAKGDKVALAHSQALAQGRSDGTYKGDAGRLVMADIDYQFAGEFEYESCASGIAAAHSFIHKQDSRYALMNRNTSGNVLSDDDGTYLYTYIGVGAAYDNAGKTFVTFDIYNIFD